MSHVIIDAAVTIDGFWADAGGESVYPLDEMKKAGLTDALAERIGAAVWSQRSFDMSDDPDWFACNYELQVPLHVVTDSPPSKPPKEACGLTFNFHSTFEEAVARALKASGKKDVLVIGETSAVEAALRNGQVDEIYLRVIPRVIGAGARLLGEGALAQNYRINDVTQTPSAVHLHFVRAGMQ